jgi:casein kinase II subunit alpha
VFTKTGDMSLKDFITEDHPYTIEDIKSIIKQLLHAINIVHEQGLIHRDIKPANVVIKPSTLETCLIDFGLAEFYFPEKEYNLRIATRPFKPIEVLLGYRKYFQSFDIWGIGNILGCLVNFYNGLIFVFDIN